jgi:phosphoglycerate dehydrogenase-like enzyme
MSGPRILIPDANFPGEAIVERETLASVLAEPGALLEVHRLLDYSAVPVDSWRRADAVMLYTGRMTIGPETVGRLESCRVVVRAGTGVDNIDLAACAARNIPVCHVPDYSTDEVADHALAMALSLRRGLFSYAEVLNVDPAEGWRWEQPPLIRRLRGSSFGVVGLGRIGSAAAARARALGCRVLYYDPYVAVAPPGLDAERRDTLDQLLADADIVSLHVPLTSETRGMIGAAQLGLMKPHALLVNTARGPVVDIDALAAALRAGRPGGAALDVLPQEPPDPDHELIAAWRMQPSWIAGRFVLSPHAAFYSPESVRELRTKAAGIVRDALSGKGVRNCVNREQIASFGSGRAPG